MQIVLHEMPKPVVWEKKKEKCLKNVVCWKFYPECYALSGFHALSIKVFYKRNNLCGTLFAFLHTKALLKGSTLKKILPMDSFSVVPFQKGAKLDQMPRESRIRPAGAIS